MPNDMPLPTFLTSVKDENPLHRLEDNNGKIVAFMAFEYENVEKISEEIAKRYNSQGPLRRKVEAYMQQHDLDRIQSGGKSPCICELCRYCRASLPTLDRK